MVPVVAARRGSQEVRNHFLYGRGARPSAVPPEARIVPAVVLPSIRLVDGESAGNSGQRTGGTGKAAWRRPAPSSAEGTWRGR